MAEKIYLCHNKKLFKNNKEINPSDVKEKTGCDLDTWFEFRFIMA